MEHTHYSYIPAVAAFMIAMFLIFLLGGAYSYRIYIQPIKPEDITDQLRSMSAETQECVRSKARSFLIHKPNSLITNEQFQGIKTSCANEQQSELTNQAQMKALRGP